MTFILAHPWWALAIVLTILLAAFEMGRILRDRRRSYPRYHAGGTISPGTEPPLILHRGLAMPRAEDRVAMRNRFLPADEETAAAVDQIIHDQAVAHEKPGVEVHDAGVTPDASTYYHLRETVAQFTFIIGKDGYVGICEAMRDGSDSPVYEVPEEWREPLTVAVFEVARLRHGR